MKQIVRSLIIGIVLGGGFGAKVGAYLSQVLDQNTFSLVEYGFGFGASIGLLSSLIIQVVSSGAFERQNNTADAWRLGSALQ